MKKVLVGRLKNGLMYYSQRDTASHVSGVGVRCGSMHDVTSKIIARGIAHLTEHNLCRVSSDYTSREMELFIEKYLGGLDGAINVRTDRYSTFYGHDTLLRRTHMLKAFDALASCVRDAIIEPEGLKTEKAAVHQEYHAFGKDVAFQEIDDLIHLVTYNRNPARNRIDCVPDDIKKLSLRRMKQFMRQYYSPNNMFVVILGPEKGKVHDMAAKYFGHMEARKIPPFRYGISESFPQLRNIRSIEIERPGIKQYHLSVGFPIQPFGHKDNDAVDILSQLLAFRLRWRLREGNTDFNKGVYRAPVFISRSFAHGIMHTWCASTSREFIKEAEDVILEECDKLRTSLVATDEFDAIWHQRYFRYLNAFLNTPGVLAELIIDHTCNGDQELEGLNSFRESYKKITRHKILSVANKCLDTKNYARALIKPV